MFSFVERENEGATVTAEYIEKVEIDLDIKFPAILRQYYLQHNGADIKECRFERSDLELCVVLIVDLKYGTMPLEEMIKFSRKNAAIPDSFVPLAVDELEDDYYWDTKDGKVYYLSLLNVEHPKEICGSVEEFFEILNAC